MIIKEIKHSVQAVISTGPYENQREMFEILATLKEGEDVNISMQELEKFNHQRLDLAVNTAKISLIEKQYSSMRFYEKDGKRYPSVTSILGWDVDWRISEDELNQYGSRGTIVHKLIEIYLTTGKWVDPQEVKELKEDIVIVLGGSLGLNWNDCSHKKFFEANEKDIKVDKMEIEVINTEVGYGGRVDAIGTYKGEPAVFDWKTGNTSDFRQLGAYAVAINPEVAIKTLIIAPVGPSDTKQGYSRPKINDAPAGEFKAFVKARSKFKLRFGI